MLRKSILIALSLMMSLVASTLPTLAKVAESECAQLRQLDEKQPQNLFFQTDRGFFPLNNENSEELLRYLKQYHPKETRFIYLAEAEGDNRPTEFMVQQIFSTDEFWNFVGTYNNIRRSPRYIDFKTYQDYHKLGKSNRELSEWFHLGPGLFTNRYLVDSNHKPLPRELFYFPILDQKGRELRTYLFAVSGLRDDGTCIDFAPSIPSSIKELRFVIQNIRQTEFGAYPPPVSRDLKFDDQ